MPSNSRYAGKRKRLSYRIIALLMCATILVSIGSSCSPGHSVILVTVNSDGTFTPSAVFLRAGDSILWAGLGRTDAIVQIGNPTQLPNADVCGLSGNELDHVFNPSDANEFTGPMRKAVSGIFALGPDDAGFKRLESSEVCPCELAAEPCAPIQGNGFKLCPGDGLSHEILDETWTNLDITGVTLRINWRDLETANDQYFWDDLDREMNRAVEHGKLFTLDIRAGLHGTPLWIFNTFSPPGPVTPIVFKDWGSGPTHPDHSCGFEMPLGSPTDTNYRELYIAMIAKVAEHVASDSRWFQALAHVKVSGANFLSSEARLPKRCFDSADADTNLDTVTKVNGREDCCVCNSQLWAEHFYTPAGLHEYYRVVEKTIYDAFYQRKSMGYQLIQAGFPKVENHDNFEGDTLNDKHGVRLFPAGTTADDGNLPGGTEQTEDNLQEGREGRFVDPFGVLGDPIAGKLFIPQHSGIGRLPDDDGRSACRQANARVLPIVDPATMRATFPINSGTTGDGDEGCPNSWAVEEGTINNQIMGFQNNNDKKVASPADVESSLWNLTINSNGVFIEIYEERLWEIFQLLGSANVLDPTRPSLAVSNPTNPAPYSKTLPAWATELHDRRKQLVDPANPNLADPFPTVYLHTFSRPLATAETYFYINPSKCARTLDATRVGTITIIP